MPEPRQIRSLGIKTPGEMYFFSYPEEALPEGHFRLETLFTGLSAGTELTFFKGSNLYFNGHWNDQLNLFEPGKPGESFPMPFLGYMEVGRVSETRTSLVKEGEVIAMAYGHKTGHTAHPVEDFWVAVPPEIDPILGIFVAQMGPICANGLLHAAADLAGPFVQSLGDGVRGRNILVTGAGTVGLLTGLFCRYFGANSVVVADTSPERLAAAEGLGLLPVNEKEQDPALFCKERWFYSWEERGADLVFQCRGQAGSLQTALRSLRPQGTVIDLAFYQGGATEVRLGEEFHHNGLSIKCAQINRVPHGLAHLWGKARLANETLGLLKMFGPLIRRHLITDVVSFDEAPELVANLAARRSQTLQAVFKPEL